MDSGNESGPEEEKTPVDTFKDNESQESSNYNGEQIGRSSPWADQQMLYDIANIMVHEETKSCNSNEESLETKKKSEDQKTLRKDNDLLMKEMETNLYRPSIKRRLELLIKR